MSARTLSRLKLLGVLAGLTITWNVGYGAAQLFGARIAEAAPGFPFQLAVLLAALLAAAHFLTLCLRLRGPRALATQPAGRESAPPTKLQSLVHERNLHASPWAVALLEGDPAAPLITYVNPAFSQLTGFPAHELTGRRGTFLAEDGPMRCESVLWLDAEGDGREVHWIARLHRRDGSPFWAEAQLEAIRAADGSIAQTLVVLSDISEQVQVTDVRRPTQSTQTATPFRVASGH